LKQPEPVFLFTLINLVIDQKARILHDFFELVLAWTYLDLFTARSLRTKPEIQGKHSIK